MPEIYYYRGENPDNWIQFGEDAEGKPILWRIISLSNDGIKLIYEGTKKLDNTMPDEDGKIFNSAWDSGRSSVWKNTELKVKLADWLEE